MFQMLLRDWLWVAITAFGCYTQGKVLYEAAQDINWILISRQNGRLLRVARDAFQQECIYLSMHAIALICGLMRLMYPGGSISNIRSWLALIVIISWEILLIWSAQRNLARRRDLLLEIRGRQEGQVKTRQGDDSINEDNRRIETGGIENRSGGLYDNIGSGPRRTD